MLPANGTLFSIVACLPAAGVSPIAIGSPVQPFFIRPKSITKPERSVASR